MHAQNLTIFQGSSQRKKAHFEAENEDQDPARVSRLFYLQLYSSVLNSEAPNNEQATIKTSQKLLPKVKSHLTDLTNTLMRKNLEKTYSAAEDFERDAGDSLHETVVVETRLPPEEEASDKMQQTYDIPVPVLNTRMKNLSQFSFRYRENERESRVRVVETKSR